jgi:hypothetical protein
LVISPASCFFSGAYFVVIISIRWRLVALRTLSWREVCLVVALLVLVAGSHSETLSACGFRLPSWRIFACAGSRRYFSLLAVHHVFTV